MKVQQLSGLIGLMAVALTACGASTGTTAATPAPGALSGNSLVAPPQVASSQALSPDEQTILNAVNAARAVPRDCDSTHHYGAAAPLTVNAELSSAALAHSQDMYKNGYIEAAPHSGSDGSSPQQRIEAAGYRNWTSTGENVAAGYTVGGGADVVEAWLKSPGHCENIMNPKFREIGISYVSLRGARYNGFFTQDFGAK